MNMDVRAKVSFALVGLAVLAVAQTGDFYLRDKTGKSSITGFKSLDVSVLSEERTQFLVIGNPFTAVWEGQKMTIKARRGEGTSLSISPQSTIIEKATMSGGVTAVASRPSRVAGPNLEQTVTIETPSLVYTAENERFAFPGRVKIEQVDRPAGQSFSVNGTSGWVDLHPSGSPIRLRQAVQAMRLEGPVSFELNSTAEVKDPDSPGKRVKKPVVVKGRGRLLTYDDATRKLTLDQDVVIEGTHPALFGEMRAIRAVLTLDANWNPISISLTGEPGTTTVNPPPTRLNP